MLIGYARTSSKDQNLDRQLDSLKSAGCEKIYSEKISAFAERKELKKMIADLKPGDVVVIHDQDRLARDPVHTYAIIGAIQEKGAKIKSLSQGEIDTTDPDEEFKTTIKAAFAKLVYAKNKISQREGIAAAKKRGKHLGRPYKLDNTKRKWAIESIEGGGSKAYVSKVLGVNIKTVSRAYDAYLKEQIGV